MINAAINIIFGSAGALCGGRLADSWEKGDVSWFNQPNPAAVCYVPAIAVSIAAVAAAAGFSFDSFWLTMLCIALFKFFHGCYLSPMVVAVQSISPVGERGALLGAFFFVDWFVAGGIATGIGEINALSSRMKLMTGLPLLLVVSWRLRAPPR